MQLSSWSLYTTTHFIEACCGLILFRATDPKFRAVRNSWVVPDVEHSLGIAEPGSVRSRSGSTLLESYQ